MMVMIRVDRDMIIEELYSLRSKIPVECDEAKKVLLDLITLINNAPLDENKSQFPRISTRGR